MDLVYTYKRCSTDEQTESGLGLEAQERAIASYCKARGFTVDRAFEDPGQSGGDELAARPAGAKLLTAVQGGDCVLIVAKLDRLFRNAGDACMRIAEWTQSGVLLCSVGEGFDCTTAFGRCMAQIFAAFAQLERDLIVERTKGAMESLRARGERISRDAPYGWRFIAGDRRRPDGSAVHVLAPDQEERNVIAQMKALRRRGKSYRDIASWANERGIPTRRGGAWSHTSIRAICKAKFRKRTPTPATHPNGEMDHVNQGNLSS